MIQNILSRNKKDLQKGQSMLEFIVVFFSLLLCTLAIIEVCRFLAFRNKLHGATLHALEEVFYSDIDLREKGYIPKEKIDIKLENKALKKSIKYNILSLLRYESMDKISMEKTDSSNKFITIEKFDIRIDGKFIYDKRNNIASGIYLETQTCLPVLFSSFFNQFSTNSTLGHKKEKRSCLGRFMKNFPYSLFWYHVRTAVYAPWPATTEIYTNGIGIPKKFSFLNQGINKDIESFLDTGNISYYLEKKMSHEL